MSSKTARLLGLVSLCVGLCDQSAYAGGTANMSSQTSEVVTNQITTSEIRGEYLHGVHFKPKHITHSGVITVFGGSEGSNNAGLARALAQEGFEVLALHFFGQTHQQKRLVNVPIDFYQEVLTYIDRDSLNRATNYNRTLKGC